ncbi:hypothetical protein H1164_13140 [Thermoactinomyces daqus]|uniref:Uncharacterized protein n=1 Tax=Thermoactinomyces daqus TaxID=1329516 RepID=A0A7W1XC47_9BACL|nr:hypothetical protein [Thermoactinomyces daqus]MBA4543833.1 hypothetical protein [Thermoactinomyces daqus]
MMNIQRFEIWFQGEMIGQAADLLETENLIDELEKKLKVKADRMIVRVIGDAS